MKSKRKCDPPRACERLPSVEDWAALFTAIRRAGKDDAWAERFNTPDRADKAAREIGTWIAESFGVSGVPLRGEAHAVIAAIIRKHCAPRLLEEDPDDDGGPEPIL